MKKLVGLVIAAGLSFGANAQSKIRGNINSRPNQGSSKVIVVQGSPIYSPYGYGFRNYGYSPYGYGFNPMFGFALGANVMPSQLELEIAQIKNDFNYEISDIRHNKNPSKS